MAEGRRNRRRWLAAAVVAVVVAGAGVAWWWRSAPALAQLPAAACWSVLTRADLEPLADGVHGRFVERNSSDGSHERLQPSHGDQDCRIERDPANGLLWVQMWSMDEITMKSKYGAGSEDAHQGESRADFGPDVQGWVRPGAVGLAFRCDNPELAGTGRPYVAVGAAAGDLTDPKSEKVHQAVLDIALKYAKNVVAGYPCTNPVRLPESVPQTATNLPDLNR